MFAQKLQLRITFHFQNNVMAMAEEDEEGKSQQMENFLHLIIANELWMDESKLNYPFVICKEDRNKNILFFS
jgi:hypothetical protein